MTHQVQPTSLGMAVTSYDTLLSDFISCFYGCFPWTKQPPIYFLHPKKLKQSLTTVSSRRYTYRFQREGWTLLLFSHEHSLETSSTSVYKLFSTPSPDSGLKITWTNYRFVHWNHDLDANLEQNGTVQGIWEFQRNARLLARIEYYLGAKYS